MATTELNILHFNDVYNMTMPDDNNDKPDRLIKDGKLLHQRFDHLTYFAEEVDKLRKQWGKTLNEEGNEVPNGLLLFSGDLFSPSVESLITGGSNMATIMNELAPDAAVPGNHEFDYEKWILSNVKQSEGVTPAQLDTNPRSGNSLPGLSQYRVVKRGQLRIGIIGLISRKGLGTVADKDKKTMCTTSDVNKGMAETCKALSAHLRKPIKEGGEECDIVIALTHAQNDEDIILADEANAYRADLYPETKKAVLEDTQGVDIIFGGHDHIYFLGAGVTRTKLEFHHPNVENLGDARPAGRGSFEEYYSNGHSRLSNIEKMDFAKYKAKNSKAFELDNETPEGSVVPTKGLLIVKSGTDFFDLSQVVITLESKPNSTRKQIVKSVKVIRHHMPRPKENWPVVRQLPMGDICERIFKDRALAGLDRVIAYQDPTAAFNYGQYEARERETLIGNWVTQTVLKAYIKRGYNSGSGQPVAFIMTGGSIRSTNSFNGDITTRMIVELSPFSSPLICLKLKGSVILDTLADALTLTEKEKETGHGTGRFPVVTGMWVKWDSTASNRKPLRHVVIQDGFDPSPIDETKEYTILTNEYLAGGGDGFGHFAKAKLDSMNSRKNDPINGDKDTAVPVEGSIPMYQLLRDYLEKDLKIEQLVDIYFRTLQSAESLEVLVANQNLMEREAKAVNVDLLVGLKEMAEYKRYQAYMEGTEATDTNPEETNPEDKLRAALELKIGSPEFAKVRESYVPDLSFFVMREQNAEGEWVQAKPEESIYDVRGMPEEVYDEGEQE